MRIAFLGDSLTEGLPGESYLHRLKSALPGHTLMNWGRGGDTIVSLHERLGELEFEPRPDAVFLWVGVNDAIVMESPYYLTGREASGDSVFAADDEFAFYYRRTLDHLSPRTARVLAVGPLFCGEDLRDPLNSRIAGLAEIVRGLCRDYPNAGFVDMRSDFFADDTAQRTLPERPGLRFTTDGVHLSSVGADIVARVFLRHIARLDW
ncbi:MAG: GDSL-type esterase/lipase family protein [bacterium]